MKLQVKTLSQKSVTIDIEETKTVYDLKKELSLIPIVGVSPELQKLIYAGKILVNEDVLSTCNIDCKKFLVVMVLKPNNSDTPTSSQSAAGVSQTATEQKNIKTEPTATTPAVSATKEPVSTPPAAAASNDEEQMVQNIVGMGYPESEVRSALAASFYNPERAIEYLIEGIPNTTEGEGFEDYSEDDAISPLDVFRGDPIFRSLRSAIRQHPEMLDDAIVRIGESNPEILGLINENQDLFLRMLVEDSEDEGEEPSQDD